jgi:hypothetical protein
MQRIIRSGKNCLKVIISRFKLRVYISKFLLFNGYSIIEGFIYGWFEEMFIEAIFD